jgi:hypothetical protein
MSRKELFLRQYLKRWAARFYTGDNVDIEVLIRLKDHYRRKHGFEALEALCREVYLEVARAEMKKPVETYKPKVFKPKVRRQEKRGRYVANWR